MQAQAQAQEWTRMDPKPVLVGGIVTEPIMQL